MEFSSLGYWLVFGERELGEELSVVVVSPFWDFDRRAFLNIIVAPLILVLAEVIRSWASSNFCISKNCFEISISFLAFFIMESRLLKIESSRVFLLDWIFVSNWERDTSASAIADAIRSGGHLRSQFLFYGIQFLKKTGRSRPDAAASQYLFLQFFNICRIFDIFQSTYNTI